MTEKKTTFQSFLAFRSNVPRIFFALRCSHSETSVSVPRFDHVIEFSRNESAADYRASEKFTNFKINLDSKTEAKYKMQNAELNATTPNAIAAKFDPKCFTLTKNTFILKKDTKKNMSWGSPANFVIKWKEKINNQILLADLDGFDSESHGGGAGFQFAELHVAEFGDGLSGVLFLGRLRRVNFGHFLIQIWA